MPRHVAYQPPLPMRLQTTPGPVRFKALPLKQRQGAVRNHIGQVLNKLDKTHRKLCHAALTQEVWAVLNAGVIEPEEALDKWLSDWLRPALTHQTDLDITL